MNVIITDHRNGKLPANRCDNPRSVETALLFTLLSTLNHQCDEINACENRTLKRTPTLWVPLLGNKILMNHK
jgi:hypothetical protein